MPRQDTSFDQDKTMLAEMDNVSRDSQHSSNNYFYNRWFIKGTVLNYPLNWC
jgi:hypothetical protein